MQIVIDISNSLYTAINNKCVSPVQIDELCRVVLNGKKVWTKRFEECGRCYWEDHQYTGKCADCIWYKDQSNAIDGNVGKCECKNSHYNGETVNSVRNGCVNFKKMPF